MEWHTFPQYDFSDLEVETCVLASTSSTRVWGKQSMQVAFLQRRRMDGQK